MGLKFGKSIKKKEETSQNLTFDGFPKKSKKSWNASKNE